jgi:hypothetical protein
LGLLLRIAALDRGAFVGSEEPAKAVIQSLDVPLQPRSASLGQLNLPLRRRCAAIKILALENA